MKAAIIGYGKSGAAASRLLKLKGYEKIEIFDDKNENYKNISEYKDEYDEVVVSPGIDLNKYKNISGNITSEIELAYNHMDKNAKIIGITGTNGKSTTTFLTAQILNNAGVKACACGNIGYPFGEAVLDKADTEVYVIELSSFQIELLKRFKAVAGCIINVTQDHLDRYGTMDKYYEAKLLLLNFIDKKGLFVTNTDTVIVNKAILYDFQARYIDDNFKSFPKLNGNILDFGKFNVDLSKYKLFGKHNITNLSFALTMADKVCDFKDDVTNLIENLTSMPHRTELVAEINGVRWINDSKATNVDSVYTALVSMKKPAILLIGGRDKKSDYRPLADLINQNISKICYFGEAADLIKSQLSPLLKGVEEESYKSLKECVKDLAEKEKDITILLSPACTSFDEFKSYEDRGYKFKDYILEYTNGGK